MSETKVYRYTAMVPRHLKLDQPDHVHQCIVIVAADSKKHAVELMQAAGIDVTLYGFKTYGSVTENAVQVEAATAKPGQVLAAALRTHNSDISNYVPVLPPGQAEYDMSEWLAEQDERAYADVPQDDAAQGDREQDGLELLMISAYTGRPVGWVGPESDLRDEIVGYPV